MRSEQLLGRAAKNDYYDPDTWEVFLLTGEIMDQVALDRLDMFGLVSVETEAQGLEQVHTEVEQWVGWGRYKAAVARALLRPGSGEIRVNGQSIEVYFAGTAQKGRAFLRRLLEQGEVRARLTQLDGVVLVHGSSAMAIQQPKAVAHALARALVTHSHDESLREGLERQGFGGVRVKDKERSI